MAPKAPDKPEAPKKSEPKVVYLIWNEQRVWVIHPTGGGALMTKLMAADAKLSKEEVQAALKKQEQFNIIPGMHEYDAHLWHLVSQHPDVEQALEDGRLVLATNSDFGLEGDPEAPAQELSEDLTKLSTGDARKLAENCQDLEVLQGWMNAEKKQANGGRSSVLEVLEAQIRDVEDIEKRTKAAQS